jgi:hypothetical protein
VHLAPSVRSASGHEQDGRQGEKGGVVRHHLGHEAQKVGAIPTPAGTQALPVDTTNAESPNGRAADFESGSVGSTPASAPKFDKKAWMREYMRGYMREYRKRPKPSTQTTTEERNEE